MTLALPLFLMMSSLNLTNTYWSVLLPGIVSPFGVYFSRIYVAAAVPDELREAARMDGAGEFHIFFAIITRLMMPALVTIFLFQFVAIWNNYFLPLIMLNNEQLYPITVGLTNNRFLALPGALVSTIPLLLGCVFLQHYWRSGWGTGGVKG
jgi:multiple sugar transport system permease protein